MVSIVIAASVVPLPLRLASFDTFLISFSEHKVVSIELANKMQEFNCELILGLVHFLQLDWPIKN